jgi:hypothetical protein
MNPKPKLHPLGRGPELSSLLEACFLACCARGL